MKQNIIITAGGTGGHIFPAFVLAKELISRGHYVLVVLNAAAARFVAGDDKVDVFYTDVCGSYGGVLQKIKYVVSVIMSCYPLYRMFKKFNPAVVVSFGSYASVPVTAVSALMGKKIILQEQNTVLGKAHRYFVSFAKAVVTGFPGVVVNCSNVYHLGNPVRPSIAYLYHKDYTPPRSTLNILVIGGSQGADKLDHCVPVSLMHLPEELRSRLNIVHQVRSENLTTVEGLYSVNGIRHEVASFFVDIDCKLANAHLIICRAGASTMAENFNAGKPAIYVPHPSSYADHQTKNANFAATKGAGIVIANNDLDDPEILSSVIVDLYQNEGVKLCHMSKAAREVSDSGSLAKLTELVLKYAMLKPVDI